jgi:hypothetical protein
VRARPQRAVRPLAPFLRGEGWGEGLLPRVRIGLWVEDPTPPPLCESNRLPH